MSGAIVPAGSTNNLIGNGTGMTGISNGTNGNQVGTAGVPINPRLSALGNYGGTTQTFALLPGSPAINAGIAGTGAPAADQRGIARVGQVDIGAFESRGFAFGTASGTTQSTIVSTPFATVLSVPVSSSFSEPVNGGIVNFTAPGSGASASLSPVNPVNISSGTASVTATANATSGSYSVTAAATGVTGTPTFSLTNIAAQPTGAPGIPSLSTTATSPANITINFTAASPTPDGYLVVRRPTVPTTSRTPPIDGTPYTVGNIFNGQTVAGVGASTTYTDNTVVFGASYFYDVYAFNGSGAAINYNVNDELKRV